MQRGLCWVSGNVGGCGSSAAFGFPSAPFDEKDWEVRINCVHCESNVVADYLARRSVVVSIYGSWVIDSPDHDVEYLMLKDSLYVP